MLRDGSKITVHFINHWNHNRPTEDTPKAWAGKIFEVKTQDGKQGIDGNPERSPYTCRGNVFTPFSAYAWTVIFRDIETGHIYRYSDPAKSLEEVTNLEDGYVNQIIWK